MARKQEVNRKRRVQDTHEVAEGSVRAVSDPARATLGSCVDETESEAFRVGARKRRLSVAIPPAALKREDASSETDTLQEDAVPTRRRMREIQELHEYVFASPW